MQNIKVVELFAGVGGFRLGLEQSSDRYETIWSNQWEPSKKVQHAFDCYQKHFPTGESTNEDIAKVKQDIPDHDLLVGGFPCQDYSVARTQAKGIEGKKGVLWWEINDVLKMKSPQYILLENVDRLLRSPANQRGRDFGVMLRCFHDLGYSVEWRVINAAEYGCAQRRRRVFIFAFRNTTELHKKLFAVSDLRNWVFGNGFFAETFPIIHQASKKKPTVFDISNNEYSDLTNISNELSEHFYNAGVMMNGQVYSEETTPVLIAPITLRDIRLDRPVEERFFLDGNFEKWKMLKGAKKIPRIKPNGEPYTFAEGGMKFPDDIDLPARTMLTSESSVNRSTHVIEDAVTGKLRLLTPIECERLNGFPDDWTNTGMPEKFRYFVMGNALVVPLIKRMGDEFLKLYED